MIVNKKNNSNNNNNKIEIKYLPILLYWNYIYNNIIFLLLRKRKQYFIYQVNKKK